MTSTTPYRSTSIDQRVLELFALVGDSFVGAKEALLHGDTSIATRLVDRERHIDELYGSLQREVSQRLMDDDHRPGELHYLVGIVRIIPELERSGDLAEHIARKAALDLTRDLKPRCRGIMEQMAELGASMWTQASVAFDIQDPAVATRLDQLDENLDDLHVSFMTEVASSTPPIAIAMELALVGRFLERFGDHAVNLARTTASLITQVDPYPKASSED
ncbi:MAG: phosphate signaling complex PhoU family protein [Ferrimicrobium sp.]|jgi:phosphate transport system protein|uniref:Phosphate uptake regulator PhoU n=1 Tax=Ferrimicrobium acidiphilum TaxID=121039 RepID=A0ABV3Y1N8_9ACTN|nr:phosphate uptake regulator PhoU [Ferrimicrobium sp.]